MGWWDAIMEVVAPLPPPREIDTETEYNDDYELDGSDSAEIMNLINGFERLVDRRVDPALLADLFLPDGIIIDKDRNKASRGKDQIVRFIAHLYGELTEHNVKRSVSTHMVKGDRDRGWIARSTSTVMMMQGARFLVVGEWNDDIVKVDDIWRFEKRVFVTLNESDNPQGREERARQGSLASYYEEAAAAARVRGI